MTDAFFNSKLSWNETYRVDVLPDQSVFFFSEKNKRLLKGDLLCSLAPLLAAGHYCADELADKLQEKHRPQEVYYTLLELEKKGLVTARCLQLPNSLATFCSVMEISEAEAYERIESTPVYMQGGEEFWSLLTDLPLKRARSLEEAKLVVSLARDYLQIEVSHIPPHIPYLLCKPFGSEIWIGPLFEPEKPGCCRCLSTRIKFNRAEENYVQETLALEHLPVPLPQFKIGENLAWNILACEVIKYILLGKAPSLEKKIRVFNIADSKQQEHFFLPLSNCLCQKQPVIPPQVITLERVKKSDTSGGYRIVTPEQTLERYMPLVSHITGLINYVAPAPHSKSSLFYVYHSGTNAALHERHKGKQRYTLREHSGGKGTTESAAKAGALCEALERYSGVFQGSEIYKEATYKELEDEALHPSSVLQFSEKQFIDFEELNKTRHSFGKVLPPFPENERTLWTPLYSLTHKKTKYYPTTLCYYGVSHQKAKWGRADSNGCAAGNCLEEAILQGFFELVERDSVAIWWYNRLVMPRVNVHSFHNPYFDALMEEYSRQGREAWVLDITTDLKIPSFVAISRLKEGKFDYIYFGLGTHLDSEIALSRALTEMNQLMPSDEYWNKSNFGDGPEDLINKQVMKDWMETIKAKEHPYLLGQEGVEKTREDYPLWQSSDLLADIEECQKIVEKEGMEMLVLDQTRSEIGLSVARVIVPGLRHFWARFAPGRLYDVPVKMGLLKTPVAEEDLNPFWMFL